MGKVVVNSAESADTRIVNILDDIRKKHNLLDDAFDATNSRRSLEAVAIRMMEIPAKSVNYQLDFQSMKKQIEREHLQKNEE